MDNKLKRAVYYPIALNLKGCLVVVVGGGKVAQRKIRNLLRVGACVKVVSPILTSLLKRLVSQGRVIWVSRNVQEVDLEKASIVIAATNDDLVNEKVSGWAKKKNIWVNAVDNPSTSDFISPAVLRKQKAIIAAYTDGRDPVLSRDLKNFLKENWDVFLSYRHRP